MSKKTIEPEKSKRLIFYAVTFVECSGDCDTSSYLHIYEDGSVEARLYDGENVCMTKPDRVKRKKGTSNIGAERADSLAQKLHEALSEFPNLNPDKNTNVENHGQYGNRHYRIDVTYKGQTQKMSWWNPPGETPKKIRPLEMELEKIYSAVKIQ